MRDDPAASVRSWSESAHASSSPEGQSRPARHSRLPVESRSARSQLEARARRRGSPDLRDVGRDAARPGPPALRQAADQRDRQDPHRASWRKTPDESRHALGARPYTRGRRRRRVRGHADPGGVPPRSGTAGHGRATPGSPQLQTRAGKDGASGDLPKQATLGCAAGLSNPPGVICWTRRAARSAHVSEANVGRMAGRAQDDDRRAPRASSSIALWRSATLYGEAPGRSAASPGSVATTELLQASVTTVPDLQRRPEGGATPTWTYRLRAAGRAAPAPRCLPPMHRLGSWARLACLADTKSARRATRAQWRAPLGIVAVSKPYP